jgi:hypothetical protein
MQYRLSTLLIALALTPPALAAIWYVTGMWEFWFLVRVAIVLLAFAVFLLLLFWTLFVAIEYLVRLIDR